MAPPPGGPPDATPPHLIATTPESVTVIEGFDDWVVFHFDEVVSEGSQPNFGTGSGDLERLVLLSPGNDVPRISWRRDRIAVRPRDGWRPNTVYRVELVSGLFDLRNNRSDTSAIVTFSTGGALPMHVLTGRAVDWAGARPAIDALVEAALLPDTLVYRTVSDSTGRFRLGPLPNGEYLVTVTLDQDRNRRRNGREGWDTVRVGPDSGGVGEVWAFERDTLPPRITGAAISDSFSIALTMSQPVDPRLNIPADSIRFRTLNDSADASPVGALPRAAHDSIYRALANRAGANPGAARDTLARPDSAARADSVRRDSVARADSLARRRTPVVRNPGPQTPQDTLMQKRLPLSNQLMVRFRRALIPGQRYVLVVRGVRAAGGAVADSVRTTLDVPKPPPPDTTRVRADSLRARGDTTTRTPAPATPPARPAPVDTVATRRPR